MKSRKGRGPKEERKIRILHHGSKAQDKTDSKNYGFWYDLDVSMVCWAPKRSGGCPGDMSEIGGASLGSVGH